MSELIERLAKEAGLERSRCAKDPRWLGSNEHLAKFAALIAEACAKEAEAAFNPRQDFKGTNLYFERCARVIRDKFPAPRNETHEAK